MKFESKVLLIVLFFLSSFVTCSCGVELSDVPSIYFYRYSYDQETTSLCYFIENVYIHSDINGLTPVTYNRNDVSDNYYFSDSVHISNNMKDDTLSNFVDIKFNYHKRNKDIILSILLSDRLRISHSEFNLTNISILFKHKSNNYIYRRFYTEDKESEPIHYKDNNRLTYELNNLPVGSYIYKDNEGRKIIYSLDHETLEYSIASYEIIEDDSSDKR
jgi:hypothetical protein